MTRGFERFDFDFPRERVSCCLRRRVRDRWSHFCAAFRIEGAAPPVHVEAEQEPSGMWWSLRVAVAQRSGEQREIVIDLGSVPIARLDELLDAGAVALAEQQQQWWYDLAGVVTLGVVTLAAVLFILALLAVGGGEEPVELHPPDDAGVLPELRESGGAS